MIGVAVQFIFGDITACDDTVSNAWVDMKAGATGVLRYAKSLFQNGLERPRR